MTFSNRRVKMENLNLNVTSPNKYLFSMKKLVPNVAKMKSV
jgi:hypothetical protein